MNNLARKHKLHSFDLREFQQLRITLRCHAFEITDSDNDDDKNEGV